MSGETLPSHETLVSVLLSKTPVMDSKYLEVIITHRRRVKYNSFFILEEHTINANILIPVPACSVQLAAHAASVD